METTFKIAESSDIEIVVKFIQKFYEFDGYPFDHCIVRTTLTKIFKNHSLGRVWLIQYGRKAIGYIILTFGYSLEYQGCDAFIDVYIQASHRRQGIGRSAISL